MLEKLRDNPRLIVAGLLVAGVFVLAFSSSGQDNNNGTGEAPLDDPETSQNAQDEGLEAGDESSANSQAQEPQPSSLNEQFGIAPPAGPIEARKTDGVYSATARGGDNQTLIVRQIVENFLNDSGEQLSLEQKLYVETNVVDNLPRDDLILVGEVVSVDESVVSDYVSSSMELSEGQLLAWAECL